MPLQATSAIEIHRRIANGEPDDVVARAVGRKERVIRHHRAWKCKCKVDRPAPYSAIDSSPADDSGPAVAPVQREVAIVSDGPAVAPGLAVDVVNPAIVATSAYMAGMSTTAIAAALGVDAYALDVDRPDFGLTDVTVSRRRLERLGKRADALERMRLHRPAQWAAWVARSEEGERAEALDSRLPRETWTGFLDELVTHQSRLLIERDFRDWVAWVKELAVARYPSMAE